MTSKNGSSVSMKLRPVAKLIGSLVAGVALSTSVMANETSENNEWPYAKGFYIGGQLGHAKTDTSADNLDSLYNAAGLNSQSTDVDKSDLGYSLFVGYRFNEHWAIEGGFQDLGDRSVNFFGSTTDLNAYYDLAEEVYPETADGLSLSILGSIPFDNGLTLTGKLGYFDWEMDAVTTELSGANVQNVGASSRDDSGAWYGVEVGYHIDYDLQTYVSYQHIPLQDDDVNVISLGLRFWFDDQPTYRPAKAKVAPKPQPVVEQAPVTPLPVAEKPKDTDGDGVYDSEDKCAATPATHKVDADGCSQYVMKPVDMKVVILYANNSSEIDKKYYDELADLASFIKEYDVDSLNVVGHTSASGSAAYNQTLSERRAQSVAKFLTERFGIDSKVINPVGKGESELVSDDPSLNRRMEVYIKSDVRMPVLKGE